VTWDPDLVSLPNDLWGFYNWKGLPQLPINGVISRSRTFLNGRVPIFLICNKQATSKFLSVV
jgi:hypothetical protein